MVLLCPRSLQYLPLVLRECDIVRWWFTNSFVCVPRVTLRHSFSDNAFVAVIKAPIDGYSFNGLVDSRRCGFGGLIKGQPHLSDQLVKSRPNGFEKPPVLRLALLLVHFLPGLRQGLSKLTLSPVSVSQLGQLFRAQRIYRACARFMHE